MSLITIITTRGPGRRPVAAIHKHRDTGQELLIDVMDVMAKLPEIAALIYRIKYFDGVVTKDESLDYSGNFCRMLGYDDKGFDELMRL